MPSGRMLPHRYRRRRLRPGERFFLSGAPSVRIHICHPQERRRGSARKGSKDVVAVVDVVWPPSLRIFSVPN